MKLLVVSAKRELHELPREFRERFLVEMNAFRPDKLNYELLGNGDAHMHWHIFPRRLTEPNPTHPVWWTPRDVMYADEYRATDAQLETLKAALGAEIAKIR